MELGRQDLVADVDQLQSQLAPKFFFLFSGLRFLLHPRHVEAVGNNLFYWCVPCWLVRLALVGKTCKCPAFARLLISRWRELSIFLILGGLFEFQFAS